jgi:hypothetical protein
LRVLDLFCPCNDLPRSDSSAHVTFYQVNEDRDKVCDDPPVDHRPVGDLTADDYTFESRRT